jgi:hypothetical protein
MGLMNLTSQLQNQTPSSTSSNSGGMPDVVRNGLASHGVYSPSDLDWHSGELSDDLSVEDRRDMWGGVRNDIPGNPTGVQQHIGQGWWTPNGDVLGAGTNWDAGGGTHYIMNQSQDGQNRPVFGSYHDAPDIGIKDVAMMIAQMYGMATGIGALTGAFGGLGAAGAAEGMGDMAMMDSVYAGSTASAGDAFAGWGAGAGAIDPAIMSDPYGVNGMDFNSDLGTMSGTAPAGSVNAGVNTAFNGMGTGSGLQQIVNTGRQVGNQFADNGPGSASQPVQTVTGVGPQTTEVANPTGATSGAVTPQTTETTGGGMPITTGTGTGTGLTPTTGTGQAPQSTDLASTLLGIGGGLWDMNNQNQASGDMLNYLRGRQQMNDNMYAPGSNEYNALWDEMSRKDAAAGRNSQYGPRSVDLAARVAQLKMDANTKMTTGISHYMAQALNQRASSPAGLISALQNGGLGSILRGLGGGTTGTGGLPRTGGTGTGTGGGSGSGSGSTPNPGYGSGNNGGHSPEYTGNGEGYDGENGVDYGTQSPEGYDGENGVDYGGNEGYDGLNGVDYGADNFDLSSGDWGDMGDWSDWDNFDWGSGFDDFGGDYGIFF